MKLVPVPDEPGHWVVPGRNPGEPGLFALVIGVSAYDHLPGGKKARATDDYGLQPLFVSALTAWRVFEWLDQGYLLDGCPLAEVWCLLAPTDAELAVEPALSQHAAHPDIDTCSGAILDWFAALKAVPKVSAEASGALFFFSGHGLETHINRQILLPADYLAPPHGLLNEAISTENLLGGMAGLDVRRQFFFLDACRNDNQCLREHSILGRQLLNDTPSAYENPDRDAPILYATAPGRQAFQPADPNDGLSLYGTALLEGLVGTPDLALEPCDSRWAVNFFPLQQYVAARLPTLIKQAGAFVQQSVKIGGSWSGNPIVTLAPADRLPIRHFVPRRPDDFLVIGQRRRPASGRGASGQDGPTGGQALFGSDVIARLWRSVKCQSFEGGQELPPSDIVIDSVAYSADALLHQIEVHVDEGDPVGHLLQFDDGFAQMAVLLPASQNCGSFVVEMAQPGDWGGNQSRPLTIRCRPALEEDSVLGFRGSERMRQLWRAYVLADYARANELLESAGQDLALLGDFAADALSAAVILAVALRCGRAAEWIDRSIERDSAMPTPAGTDLTVLSTEALLRISRKPADLTFARSRLISLSERCVPVLGDALAYASRRVRRIAAGSMTLDADGAQPATADAERVHRLDAGLERALVYARTDGVLMTYAHYPDLGFLHRLLSGAATAAELQALAAPTAGSREPPMASAMAME